MKNTYRILMIILMSAIVALLLWAVQLNIIDDTKCCTQQAPMTTVYVYSDDGKRAYSHRVKSDTVKPITPPVKILQCDIKKTTRSKRYDDFVTELSPNYRPVQVPESGSLILMLTGVVGFVCRGAVI